MAEESTSSTSSLSSSSGDQGATSLAFRVEGVIDRSVWCFAGDSKDERTIYAGTGPNGIVLKSTDLSTWTIFTTIEDCHVRSLAVWANALFMGTQPKGRIYVHNFKSDEEYLFVETEDESVVAFAEYNGKLFAGTAPAGIVYSFDGIVWKEEHRPYGGGVTAMATSDKGLFVFSRRAEGPVVFDGSSWTAFFSSESDTKESSDDEQESVVGVTTAAQRVAQNGIHGSSGNTAIARSAFITAGLGGFLDSDGKDVSPALPQFNVTTAVQVAGGVAFGGLDNGVVVFASVNNEMNSVSKLFDIGSQVSVLASISPNCIMAASKGTVFIAQGEVI